MIAYSFGLSLAPTLVGFILAIGVMRYILKIKILRLLKIISYIAALIFSTIIHTEFLPLADSSNIAVGTLLGFVLPIVMALLIRKILKSKRAEEI
jgi:hypothetical protein